MAFRSRGDEKKLHTLIDASVMEWFASSLQRQRLYSFVRKNALQDDDAQDVVQQVYLEALIGLHAFRGDASVSTWMHGIAKNLVRHHHTRGSFKRQEALSEEILRNHSRQMLACPLEQLEQSRQMQWLEQALQNLAPASRQLLILIALEDLSYEDAARRLSIPVGTVRSRLSRARSTLRAQMAAEQI